MYSDTKIIDTDIYIQVYKHRFTDVDIDICDKQKYKDNRYRYVEVSRNAKNSETNAKKFITRPIMTETSPNSPHIALTYTKLRFDNFFDHTYPPSWP